MAREAARARAAGAGSAGWPVPMVRKGELEAARRVDADPFVRFFVGESSSCIFRCYHQNYKLSVMVQR